MAEFAAPDLVAPDPDEPDPAVPDPPGPDLVAGPPADPAAALGLVLDAPLPAPATVDSDADGTPDTALVADDHGLLLATDLDRDGHVDAATLVTGDGVLAAHRDAAGLHTDARPWSAPAPPASWVDPATGEWTTA